MTVNPSELLDAFEFSSAGEMHGSRALLNTETGEFVYIAEGLDEPVPDDIEDAGKYLSLPRRNDLDLGRRLVLSFVDHHLPDDYDRVADYFHRRGAYRRFRDLLEHRDMLDAWRTFENRANEHALRLWCEEHGVQVSGAAAVAA